MNSFESMVNTVMAKSQVYVTQEQYISFQNQWIFDAIGGKRYGQAFCEFFGVPRGTPLYYFRDNKIAERWIQDNYLK